VKNWGFPPGFATVKAPPHKKGKKRETGRKSDGEEKT